MANIHSITLEKHVSMFYKVKNISLFLSFFFCFYSHVMLVLNCCHGRYDFWFKFLLHFFFQIFSHIKILIIVAVLVTYDKDS